MLSTLADEKKDPRKLNQFTIMHLFSYFSKKFKS